jgi:hypothetical protein
LRHHHDGASRRRKVRPTYEEAISMAKLSVTWNNFTVHKKHDVDREHPYLWVFGIVIDAKTLVSKDFIVRRPCESDNLGKKYGKGDSRPVPKALDMALDVSPIVGFLAGGVVVVAWENAMTRNTATISTYEAAADAINEFIKEFVNDGLADGDGDGAPDGPSETEIRDLSVRVADTVRRTIREGWTLFQLVPDDNIGSAQCLLTFDGPETRPLDFRFVKKTSDYQLEGELVYTG